MALSENEIEILLEAGSIISSYQRGKKDLSEREQESLTEGYKTFIFLAENIDSISTKYRDLAVYITGKGIPGFIETITPTILSDTAEEVRKEIAEEKRQKRIAYLQEFLINLLLAIYKENKKFTWADIPPKNIIDFKELAYLEHLKDEYEAYLEIRAMAELPEEGEEKEKEEEHIDISKAEEEKEEEAAPPPGKPEEKPPEEKVIEIPAEAEITAGKADLNILAANIAAMADQEALIAGIRQKYKDQTTKDLDRLIRIAVRTAQLRLITEYAKNATSESIALTQTLNQEINPKAKPLTNIETTSRDLVTTAIAVSGISFAAFQIETAVDNCTGLIVANGRALTSADREEVAEIVQLSLSATGNREYNDTSPIAGLYSEFDQAIVTNRANLDPAGNLIVPAGQLILNKNLAISLPSKEKIISISEVEASVTSLDNQFSLPTLDQIEISTQNLGNLVDRITVNPNTVIIINQISQAITKEQIDTFVRAVNATPTLAGTFIRSFPTDKSEQAKAIDSLQPGNPTDPEAISIYSMGLTAASLARIYQYAQTNPDSPVAKVINDPSNKSFIGSLTHSIAILSNNRNQLGADLNPNIARVADQPNYQVRPATGIFQNLSRNFQVISNRFTSFVPPQIGRFMNVALHPIQFFQDRVGKFLADRVTNKVKGWVASQVVKRVGTEVVKKLFEQGAKLLIKEGLKKAIEGMLVATGVGALAAPLVEVAFWLGEKVLGLIGNGISKTVNGLSRMLTGEDFDAKAAAGTLLTAPFAVAGAVGGIIGGLASATAVAASTATIVLIGSTFVGFILYVTVIGVAPIIASIAQLESGIGVQQGILPSLRYPAYTGAILPGCPSTWPVPPGSFILQGPHGTFSHRTIEAIDVFVPVGSTITSITSGVVTKTGWGNAYGNWIWIESTTEGGKSFSVIYAHLTEIGVVVGDRVGEGSPIALSGATSSVPAYRNPHLHLEYRGIAYNSCPAGGVQIPEGCADSRPNIPGACLINNQPIYTN